MDNIFRGFYNIQLCAKEKLIIPTLRTGFQVEFFYHCPKFLNAVNIFSRLFIPSKKISSKLSTGRPEQ